MSQLDACDGPQNFTKINQQIQAACKTARRENNVTITAVSKKHEARTIYPVLAMGHRTFGENRVQEAMQKWPALREEFDGIDLRLIGPLQSNKAKEAVGFFNTIETLDRPKIAKAIASEMSRQDKAPKLFIQINTGDEPQKAGISPLDADRFIKQCRDEFQLSIEGLMCIPPVNTVIAPHFALLGRIAQRNGISSLSMGMSGDYIEAVKLGANFVRIGSAIFGPRPNTAN